MLSVYRNSNDTHGSTVTLEAAIERIHDGKHGLDEKTRYCHATATTDPKAYKIYKETSLPAVTFSGTFPKGKRKAQHLIDHSSLITIDIDGLLPSQIPDLLAELAQMQHVVLAFISPSGLGIKVIVRVDPIPANDLEHKGAYQACLDFFESLAEEYQFEVDTTGKDCSRLCYLSHDPLAIFHTDTPAVDWDKEAWIQEQRERQERFEAEAKKAYTGKADVKALDHIDPNDLKYDQWLSVITACKVAGLSWQQADMWSKRGGVRYTEGEIETRWSGLNLDVSWGAVVNLAKLNGFIPIGRNYKPIKLEKRSDLECITEPIEKAREALRSTFDKDKKLIGFRGDTGIGKNHEAIILYQIKGIGGFISTPSTQLAIEQEIRLYAAGVNVFRWRGLHAEPDGQFPHEKPCMFPDTYKAYAESGRNAYKMLCEPSCPHLDECEQDGYRSQEAKAKAAQVTVAAHKDLLFNPLFRNTAGRLLPTTNDAMIIIDEFDVFESFIEVEIAQARLEYLRDTWHDHPLGNFAKDLLNAIVVQNAPHTGITEILNTLAWSDREAIIEALASYRIGDTVFDRKEAHEITADIGQSAKHVERLPKIETETWNLLIQLELFIDVFRHPTGAPFEWADNTLTFYLPPLPLYTNAKIICMSATLNQTFFEKVFETRQEKRGDVGFMDADDTEWDPGAKVYQLRTNRNPRSTLLTAEKIKDDKGKEKWHYTGFSKTGQHTYDAILESVKANPHRQHALISFKWIIDTHADELKEANIITGHFGGLVGLDHHFLRDTDTPIVLHILGAPEVPPSEVEHRYKLLYGDIETPPDFTRNETTGEYLNKDMQTVYEAGVKAELMQANGRAGLVKNPSTVVLWTSHDLPSLSHREQTQHFDESDWKQAEGDISILPTIIQQREAQETASAVAINTGDVETVMEMKGVAKSQAYELTKETRPQRTAREKAERDAKVIALWDNGDGLNASEIERQTRIPRATVNRILKPLKQGDQSSDALYSTYIEDWKSGHPPENPDVPCVKNKTLHTHEPIPDTDYSRLDLDTAKQELVRCQQGKDYNGAAFLRNLIKNKERQQANKPTETRTPTDVLASKGASMDHYNILTIPGSELFAKIGEINAIANDDTSDEQETAIDALNNLSSLLEQRSGSREESLVAPGQVLSFGTMSLPLTHTPD